MNTDTWFRGFRRESARIRDYDYTQPGAYFLTIATFKKGDIFGDIKDDTVFLNERGRIALNCWLEIPIYFTFTRIDEFIVMPNHVHGILWIDSSDNSRDTACRVSTIERFGKPVLGSIPTIVRSYKSAVTKKIRLNEPGIKIWQSNYYDHIIRNEDDLGNIRAYIKYNAFDRFDF